MASIAKFDTWQNTSGVNMGTVVQVKHHYWNTVSTYTARNWTEVTDSYFEIVTKVTNSKIDMFHSGHLYKQGSTQGYGLQFARVIPNQIDLWNPYSVWGGTGHGGYADGAAGCSIHYTDDPLVPAGTKLGYVMKVWKNLGQGYISFNSNGAWGGIVNAASSQNPSQVGYNTANGIIITEIAPN